MQYFTIKNFRPIEAKEEATDQDRSVLRACEGMIPVPQGALSTGPQWRLLWGIDDLPARMATALAGANATKTHFVQVTRSGSSRVLLAAWSVPLQRCLGLFEVAAGDDDATLTATSGVTFTATASAPWRDLDGAAMWYGYRAGNRWLLGNGVDANLQWKDGVLSVFGPASVPTDPQDRSRVRIPPCTCFRLNANRQLFATGNPTHPLRVWITEAPNAAYSFFPGVQSLATSFVDVYPHGGATKTVALSTYQNYVTVHTDRSPVNIYNVNGTSDGWKCDQAPSAANASAANPNCVGDANGDASYYLGVDLELYADQAVRSGPPEKRGARDQEIVTTQAAGIWNRAMQRVAGGIYATLYDRDTRLLWVFARSIYNGQTMLWLYNERTRTCAGPLHYPDATAAVLCARSIAIVTTAEGSMLFSNLADVGERRTVDVEEPGTELGAAYAPESVWPDHVIGVPFVGVNEERSAFCEKAAAANPCLWLESPFKDIVYQAAIEESGWTYYNNATLARLEFPWQDLGSADVLKNFLEVRLTLERASRGLIGIYCETDRGIRSRKNWFGQVHPCEKIAMPLNLLGRRMRIVVVAVLHNDARLMIREASIGYTVGTTN